MMNILSHLRVIEFGSDIAGPYCAKLFADAGADVIKVESETGDPLRRRAVHGEELEGKDSALFRFLNGSKRSVVGEPSDEAIQILVSQADVVIDSFAPSRIDIPDLRRRQPSLVVISVTPYGRGGAWETRPWTEFTVQAESGSTGSRGEVTTPPLSVGGRLFEWIAGTYAAFAGLAATMQARRTGRGDHVDCSMLEAATLTSTNFTELMHALMDRPLAGLARRVERPSIEPTLDGWVGFNTNTRPQLDSFLLLIERPDLIGNETWQNGLERSARGEEWDQIVRTWTQTKPTDEIVDAAALLRIPVAPVLDGRGVLEHPQFKERGLFVSSPDGDFVQPLPPYIIDGERAAPRHAAPRLGEHSGGIEARDRRADPSNPEDADSLPLNGIRVVDATGWWAGPHCTQLLSYLGADVIHLESITRPDGARTVMPSTFEQWWERTALFSASNTNKRDVTLGLDKPRGLELAKGLIASADLVIENFSPRVFEQFGLTWETIQSLNPRTSFVRMPAFGLTGPWRNHVGFAQTMEQISGIAWVTGYGEQPRIPLGPCDPNAGTHVAIAALLALEKREKTGRGSFVEATMAEAALNVAAEQSVVYSAYGITFTRAGNRGPDAAPQGIYPCEGEDKWLALAIASDEQWMALVDVLARPAWALAPELAQASARRSEHDRIDAELTAWAREQSVDSAVDALVRAGIPAARVADPRTIGRHPRHIERSFNEEVDHPVSGKHLIPGPPFRLERIARWHRTHAPLLGEHNGEVFSAVLSLDDSTYQELVAEGVAGNAPAGL
jgi:crotonobetainyl-CoA:carnitine CoA-transferase CaiB-like acyl-CoA transferase